MIELERIAGTPMAAELRIREHVLRVDAPPKEGGEDTGPEPHDLYDAALASCKALTVLWYARHKGWTINGLTTQVERDAGAERSGTYRLAVRMQVDADLSDAQWAELQRAAGNCPIHKLMTKVTTEISTEVAHGHSG
ncbi:OsmC family protein [Diaphorobacter caeni]|uniref:OsmC family protein n=1 Tax=Diaphorobacter caeni TaxID=2784387 RepID=UPI00188F38A3|nr:OsmC family protein [Diaphorobacter caeni]MBF5004476.1 OsmC family protein [Diaphorobacter caeni]